jgi:hypothetical protein
VKRLEVQLTQRRVPPIYVYAPSSIHARWWSSVTISEGKYERGPHHITRCAHTIAPVDCSSLTVRKKLSSSSRSPITGSSTWPTQWNPRQVDHVPGAEHEYCLSCDQPQAAVTFRVLQKRSGQVQHACGLQTSATLHCWHIWFVWSPPPSKMSSCMSG